MARRRSRRRRSRRGRSRGIFGSFFTIKSSKKSSKKSSADEGWSDWTRTRRPNTRGETMVQTKNRQGSVKTSFKPPTSWYDIASPKKSKRDKRGFHRFVYYGVSGDEYMKAMRTGKYRGMKISRKGSSISQKGTFISFTVAEKIPKKDRYVI